jgi:hypothetical protein
VKRSQRMIEANIGSLWQPCQSFFSGVSIPRDGACSGRAPYQAL